MTTAEPPPFIQFADEPSRENYQKAMAGTENEYGFLPLIVIRGPIRSGKTILARHILEARFGSASCCSMPSSEDGWGKLLTSNIKNPYLFIDNIYGALHSQSLASFLTSKEWTWRKLGSQEMQTSAVQMQIIATCNHIELSSELYHRSICIELITSN